MQFISNLISDRCAIGATASTPSIAFILFTVNHHHSGSGANLMSLSWDDWLRAVDIQASREIFHVSGARPPRERAIHAAFSIKSAV
jgi:hypothetical protein